MCYKYNFIYTKKPQVGKILNGDKESVGKTADFFQMSSVAGYCQFALK